MNTTKMWTCSLGFIAVLGLAGCSEEVPLADDYTLGTLTVTVPEKKAEGKDYDMGFGDTVKPDLCAVIVPSSGETFTYHGESRPRRERRDKCYTPYCSDTLSCTFRQVALTPGKFQMAVWDLDGMDGDGGELIANLKCETGKETCEGKGVVVTLGHTLAGLVNDTTGPKGSRARPCKYAGGHSLHCMDFTLNTEECVGGNTPVLCRNKWVEARNYDRREDRGIEINNWESDGTWEKRKNRLMLFETQSALGKASRGLFLSYPAVHEGKKRFSAGDGVQLFMSKAIEDEVHAQSGIFRGLIQLKVYDEGMMTDEVVAIAVTTMSEEEFDKEVLALEFEALLANKPTYRLEQPRLTSLPQEFAGTVLATKIPVGGTLHRDILLARNQPTYIAAFGEAYVTSRLSREGIKFEQVQAVAKAHKARQDALVAKMSPLQKLAWYGRPANLLKDQLRNDNWALMRPGSKDCDGKRVDVPYTANEFQHQALLPKVPAMRKERLKKYKEELQLISYTNTHHYNDIAKPGESLTTVTPEEDLNLRGRGGLGVRADGVSGILLKDGKYNFKKQVYEFEITGGRGWNPNIEHGDHPTLKIPLKMPPEEAQRYLDRPLPGRMFVVHKFKKRTHPRGCNDNWKGRDWTKLLGYEIYIGDKLIASQCKDCEKYVAKLPK